MSLTAPLPLYRVSPDVAVDSTYSACRRRSGEPCRPRCAGIPSLRHRFLEGCPHHPTVHERAGASTSWRNCRGGASTL